MFFLEASVHCSIFAHLRLPKLDKKSSIYSLLTCIQILAWDESFALSNEFVLQPESEAEADFGFDYAHYSPSPSQASNLT